ncbi:MAG: hypothetical protein QOG59_2699 [Solirubrobacteraceae bacterium]|nr:hypothetical protein [Solirubrobacteraceae bacterium]
MVVARSRRILIATGLLLALAPGLGQAIPWDGAGAIPPSRTPPPKRPDPLCEQSYADDPPRGGAPLTFGIGPGVAGQSGATQTTPVVPERPALRDAAIRQLAGHRAFVLRLNRLFESGGQRAIAAFARLARHYGRLGVQIELQVRYHPTAAHNGDVRRWLSFVAAVVRTFGSMPFVTSLQIANEVNLNFSPNTSDGAYRNATTALIRGVITAKALARRLHDRQLRIGFNYAWRFDARADAAFWRTLGRSGGAALRRATDWVGVDIYPGTYVPPPSAVLHLGDALLEGLAQVRKCYMPLAGFSARTPMRIEETGWPTGAGRSPAAQNQAMRAIVGTANAYRGTYNITDLRWFDLRDNNSHATGVESHFGLLDDQYSPKPGFATYRRLIARWGARQPSARPAPRLLQSAGHPQVPRQIQVMSPGAE